MHVTLVMPNYADRRVQMPLGIGYIAAVLERRGFDVRIVDMNVSGGKLRLGSTDIVGISCMTKTWPQSLELARMIKEEDADIPVVFGGPHPTAATADCMKHSEIDFCVAGEAEVTAPELFLAIGKGKNFRRIKGIAFRENGGVKRTKPRPLIQSLDSIPFPAYHLFEAEKYFRSVVGVETTERMPWATMTTSRGCPYSCIFCYHAFGRSWRARSPENIFAEIKMLVEDYKIREILFLDDNFTVDRKRAIEICNMVIDSGYDLTFRLQSGMRANLMDYGLMRKMRDAGVYRISLGIESGSPQMLKRMKKDLTLNQVRKAVAICNKLGIEVVGFFIIGLPGETRRTAYQTMKFAKELQLTDAAFFTALPLPGTEFYEWSHANNFLECNEWSGFDVFGGRSISRTEALTTDQIAKLAKIAYRQFYFRPKTLLRKLTSIKSLPEAKIAFDEVVNWFKPSRPNVF